MQVVLQENEKQYEQWKAGMEDINIKYHDLRHEIEFLKENRVQSLVLEKAEKALDDYGSVVRTGNDMLDVLLTGKKLICRREKVQFICVVDGELFGGFDSSKLYSLLNNALDNAIECAGKFADEQKRFVSLTVRRVGMFISVNVSNRCEDKIEFYDGLPAPGKKGGWHGYGVKSMKRITELLGGAISASLTDNMFNLDILLPVPQ